MQNSDFTSDAKISGLLKVSFEAIKSIVDVNTIVGSEIKVSDSISIIPISKVKTTFISGGSEFNPKKDNKNPFGGASGGVVVLDPVCFICVSGSDVKVLHANNVTNIVSEVIKEAPEVINKFKRL